MYKKDASPCTLGGPICRVGVGIMSQLGIVALPCAF